MTEQPEQSPVPGWYPDPSDPTLIRYWNGQSWTEYTAAGNAPAPDAGWATPPAPATGWTQPGDSAPAGPYAGSYPAGAAAAEFQAYHPQAALAGSGMRRVSALFGDAGRIIRRAWWPITAFSVVLWLVWGALVAALVALLVDFGRLSQAITLWRDSTQQYRSDTHIPPAVMDQIVAAFRAVPRTDALGSWLLAGLVLVVATLIATAVQVAGVTRLGMSAAAGRDARLAAAWRAGLRAGPRLLGYAVLLTVLVIGVLAVVGLVSWLLWGPAPSLVGILWLLTTIGLIVLAFLLTGRFAPLAPQAVLGRGALSWSWRATATRFWPVLGRYLLWALAVNLAGSVAANVVTLVVFVPTAALLATGWSAGTLWAVLVLSLVGQALASVLTAFMYLGPVPIWRDLTDDPDLRAIAADGTPVPEPR